MPGWPESQWPCCWLAQDRTAWLYYLELRNTPHSSARSPNGKDNGVAQPVLPCLTLRRETLCLISSGLFLPQAQLLKELEHRVTQETLHRQQLDLLKTSSMEKLLEDVEQKKQHLRILTEEAERASKLGQLQRKKIQREVRQVTPVRVRRQELFHSSRLLPASHVFHGRISPPLSLLGPPGKWKYLYHTGWLLRLLMAGDDGLMTARPGILAPLQPTWKALFPPSSILWTREALGNSDNLEKQPV